MIAYFKIMKGYFTLNSARPSFGERLIRAYVCGASSPMGLRKSCYANPESGGYPKKPLSSGAPKLWLVALGIETIYVFLQLVYVFRKHPRAVVKYVFVFWQGPIALHFLPA